MTSVEVSSADEVQVEEFAGTLFMAALATLELANVELGVRLGLYEALWRDGPQSSGELANATGTVERYVREWLEQQAVSGVLEVDDAAQPPKARSFSLPTAHAHVLLDEDSEACMKPCAAIAPWVAKSIEIMTDEFRRGTGVAFGTFGVHDLQAAFTRPVFRHHLVQNWLPALPELQAKLSAGAPVRIAEVGCGTGVAALTIAEAYPQARVDGFDLDEASIAVARENADRQGLADRVHFEVRDAGDPTTAGDYDLVLAIEMIHDVPDPVSVLRTMRTLAGTDGTVLVADERTEDTLTVPGNEMERFFYSFSPLHCLAVSMQDSGAGTGTVMRADTLRAYATQAGFSAMDILDVEHPQFRLYQLS
jgi:2-polyprenyl-3-methyl-5-hydroxy-6-metoxy-1,4-benzoquinol methylase